MAKTITDTYNDDPTYDLTLQDILVVDPDSSTSPTTSKGITFNQLIEFSSSNMLSAAGNVQFKFSTSTLDEGTPKDIFIDRTNYRAYPLNASQCTITAVGLVEGSQYSLKLDEEDFLSGSTAVFQQYEVQKILTVTSIPDSITTDSSLVITLSAFTDFEAGDTIMHISQIINAVPSPKLLMEDNFILLLENGDATLLE